MVINWFQSKVDLIVKEFEDLESLIWINSLNNHIDLTLRMSLGMEVVEVSKPIPKPSPSKGVAKKGIITVLFCVKGEKTVACVMCVCA